MKRLFEIKKAKVAFITVLFLTGIFFVFENILASESFFIDRGYDFYNREKVEAEMFLETNKLIFYIDENYSKGLTRAQRNTLEINLNVLGNEFNNKIYPRLTSLFGKEPSHNEEKITVLFHKMDERSGGYFRSGDQYLRLQYPQSNERNILYLNINYINNHFLPAFIAHEFVHIITFNQKNNIHNVEEEIWLNELRAEYAITYLGYNDNYQGSNLEMRVNDYLGNLNNSPLEWNNIASDYGSINLLGHYIVDHYGIEILADSLKSSKVGMESINYVLEKNGYEKTFSNIFTNWTIATFLNDCDLGEKYCYNNNHLKDFRISPQVIYLPFVGRTSMIVSVIPKEWSGNWQRIVGGRGDLTVKVETEEDIVIKTPYVLCENSNDCFVEFIENEEREITIEEFNGKSLTIIPSIQDKTENFNGSLSSYRVSFDIKTEERIDDEDKKREELLAIIESLKKEVKRLKAEIAAITGKYCVIKEDLYFGITNSDQVRCLQRFLKEESDVYPEGLVTGNFLNLTQEAVVKFQEKYSLEILKPLDLSRGTGFVGRLTREKINSLIVN